MSPSGFLCCWQRVTHRRIAAWSPSRHGRALLTALLWRSWQSMLRAHAKVCWWSGPYLVSSV